MPAPADRLPADPPRDTINLRAWFLLFLLWMYGLTRGALWGLAASEQSASGIGMGVWVFCVYAFYLSLCCTFFPAPTTWIVLLVASDLIADAVGLPDGPPLRLALVATVGALATAMANLNEYHLFTWLLRYGKIARVRQTRLYRSANDWFQVSPFLVIALFSFIPIPVDVIRWLAITSRYPRGRFFAAYFIGRWLRYAVWALAAVGFHLSTWQILTVQAVLVVIALGRIAPRLLRHLRGQDRAEATAPAHAANSP